jgi:hypothetical protein
MAAYAKFKALQGQSSKKSALNIGLGMLNFDEPRSEGFI